MATPPKRVNAGGRTTVNGTQVINADDRDVEREHLNRILKSVGDRLLEVEDGVQNGIDNGVTVHGLLSGLSADDHPQYHNNVRALIWLLATLDPQSGVDIEQNGTSVELYILTADSLVAEEALTAGDFVNVNLTTSTVQLADASVNDKMADGFVLQNYADAATNVRVYYGAENNALSGLLPGHTYYLSDTNPGGVTETPPGDASPIVVQQLGRALTSSRLLVNIQSPIERPVEN